MSPWRALFRRLSPAGPRSRLSVLIFHRVLGARDELFPDEQYNERFAAQMKWVRESFNVLPLSEGIRRLADGSLPERPLCITFDDGYADNCSIALPILKDLGLTATFFIATGFLNGGRMWNDAIIESIRRAVGSTLDLERLGLRRIPIATLAEKQRAIDIVIGKVKYLSDAERLATAEQIASEARADMPDRLMMTDAEVRKLHREGMEIGAHTVNHPILANLSSEAAEQEIAAGKRALEAIIDAPVELFAYPNGIPGQDYGPDHVRIVRASGFRGAVSTAWGAARAGADIFQLPRFTPWDAATWKFGLRLAQNLGRTEYRAV